MDDIINQFVLWKPIKITSAIIYALILILLPFSSFWATILLFALICFWSRIPCLVSVFTKDLECIDFFTVLLAIHVGGVFGGIFGAAIMLFSRIFGPNEWYLYTIKDAIAILIGGLMTPLLFVLLDNPLYTMYCFTLIRYAVYLILTVMLEPEYLGLELGLCFSGIFVAYFSNTIMMTLFAEPLSKMLAEGVTFDITLFIFATSVVGFYYLASRLARWLEARMVKKVEAGLEPQRKPPFYMLDAEAKKMPLFVKTT
jgi:hypothetical protein